MEKNDSFILYQRYEHQISLLTMEQRGELLTAIFSYNGTGVLPDVENAAVKMALLFITEQLDYDKEKYAKKCETNRINGAKSHSGKRRGDKVDPAALPDDSKRYRTVANGTPSVANATLSESESDSVSVSDSESVSECVNTPGAPARTREEKPPDEPVGYKLYGRYRNVRLRDAELAELKSEFADIEKRIERLSEYIAGHGDRYQNHCAVIREWSKNVRDVPAPAAAPDKSGFDTDEFFGAALARAEKLIDQDSADVLQGLKAVYGKETEIDPETGEVVE